MFTLTSFQSATTGKIPYSDFRWCKLLQKSVQTLQKKFFAVFIFVELGMFWPHLYWLMRHLWSISYGFVGILYSRRLIFLYSKPFRGQTDCREPTRSHRYSTYTCIAVTISIFSFSWKQVCQLTQDTHTPVSSLTLDKTHQSAHSHLIRHTHQSARSHLIRHAHTSQLAHT